MNVTLEIPDRIAVSAENPDRIDFAAARIQDVLTSDQINRLFQNGRFNASGVFVNSGSWDS